MESTKGCEIHFKSRLMLISILLAGVVLLSAAETNTGIKINPKIVDDSNKRSNGLTKLDKSPVPAPSNSPGKRVCYPKGHECRTDPTLCCHNCGCIMPVGVCFGINC
ncbi:hypothetical protein DCAR_0625591 [Daucus carota subsp. sativus]|uniref:Uncharacterized protein n=1 Tax=Daucus carota subsp. sativus TaxID=79200 RepID=A0A164WJX6_DAUCS|nr:hypothetical protein DCAR_0625591 [Daucus carota subsp. sativus]